MRTIAPITVHYPSITRQQRILLAQASRKQKARNDFWKKYSETHPKKETK